MACRSLDKANEAVEKIRRHTSNGKMIPLTLDLSSFDSIKSFATEIKSSFDSFDCFIQNAGLAVNGEQYTKEGFEVHFGVNYLGHFLLTDLLKEEIDKNNSRLVIVSSRMHEKGTIDFENLGKYLAPKSRTNNLYNNSKLMNFYFARELFEKGYDAHVLCPGLCHTDFFRNYNPKWYHYIMFSPIALWYLRSAPQGAQNIIFCATENENGPFRNPSTGYYIKDLKQCKSKIKFSEEISKRLWENSLKLCRIMPK